MHALAYLALAVRNFYFRIRAFVRRSLQIEEAEPAPVFTRHPLNPMPPFVEKGSMIFHKGCHGKEPAKMIRYDRFSGKITLQMLLRPHVIVKRQLSNPCISFA